MSLKEIIPSSLLTPVPAPGPESDLAIMLTGGGARAAYQVGLLRGIARHFPALRFDVVTGVSAGAINAAFLAAEPGPIGEKVEQLSRLWGALECQDIFEFDFHHLIPFRSLVASLLPKKRWKNPRGFVDTTPLRRLLERILHAEPGRPIDGIIRNLRSGDLHAVALLTLDYSTGQSVQWVQGRRADSFEGPNRRNEQTLLTVDHILASAALPFIFPAVALGDRWHGDGGIRLAAPLSSAVHLGARRILAMSTGYQRTMAEASSPVVDSYPPVAQVLSQLVNAVFLDAIDEDVARMERMNALLRELHPDQRDGLKPIDLFVMRPSVDLGKLATEYEKYLPMNLKLLIRATGSHETESPDFVSMLMFEPNFTKQLIEIGERDVESRLGELRLFFAEEASPAQAVG
jgi:NTE family protein